MARSGRPARQRNDLTKCPSQSAGFTGRRCRRLAQSQGALKNVPIMNRDSKVTEHTPATCHRD